jgi:hypothetical protein
MDLRSDRTATGFAQQVNYLPALSKQHTLRLITLYPYATQPTGEFALQGDVAWTIPKGGWLGNDETMITLNASLIHGLDTTHTGPYTYDAKFMWGNEIYYRDVNFEILRKFGRDFKTTLTYVHLDYNQDVIERRAAPGEKIYGLINASIEPEWVIEVADHLLTRKHFDPHWSRSQGRVIASEQISLHGLVLAPKRPIRYAGIDARHAREIFITEGLVPGEVNLRIPLLERNQRVLQQARTQSPAAVAE